MSNIQVGTVYQQIMKEVIGSSQITFEEEGVELSVLEELRTRWQKNLSSRQCAAMPWDPPPASVVPTPGTIPSNATRPQPLPLSGSTVTPTLNSLSNGPAGVQIKAEPGSNFNLQALPPGNLPPNYGNQAALQRAGQNLQDKFGASASLQVNQLNQRAAMMAQGGARPQNAPNPMPLNDEQRRQYEERRRYAQAQQQQTQQQYQNMKNIQQAQQRAAAAVNNGQTDGASDWGAMVAQRRAEAQQVGPSSYHADMTIRQQLVQASREMEGGGLMRPLSQHSSLPVTKKRRTETSTIAQLDGRDDTDDDDKTGIKDDPDLDDEDAINSDLDDPDDNAVDETEEEDNQGEVMVCTYDKVQRVKNKWKCTLKDGVLTTGGKEYVFHKATGEFEW